MRQDRRWVGAFLVMMVVIAACSEGASTESVAVVADTGSVTPTIGSEAQSTEPTSTSEPPPSTQSTTAPDTEPIEPEPETTPPPPFAVERTVAVNGAETSLRPTATNDLTTTVFDLVVPTTSGPIQQISWQGLYTHCRLTDTEAVPHATGFDIALHPDLEGQPDIDLALWSITVGVEETAQTQLEAVDNQPCQNFDNDSLWSWYSYTVTVEGGPELVTGDPVWISIRAEAPGYDPFWGWRSSGTTITPSQQLFNGGLTPVTTGDRVLTILVG